MPCSIMKCQCGGAYLPQRYIMVILMCLAFIITFSQAFIFSLVESYLAPYNNVTISPCGFVKFTHLNNINKWDNFAKAIVEASYFLGLFLSLLPSGYMADRFGGRLICITGIFSSSFVTICLPLVVDFAFFWMVCLWRGIIGVSNACVLTSAAALISRWIPRYEWATVCGAVFSCATLTIIFGDLLGALMQGAMGWRSAFYIWGGIGMIWTLFALIWLYSNPTVHPRLSHRERTYLEEETKARNRGFPLDWVAIFLDPAVWAIAAAQVGHAYLIFAYTVWIPHYYGYVLKMEYLELVLVVVIPFAFLCIIAVLTGYGADYFVHTKGFRPSRIWKLYYTIATVLPGIYFLLIPMMKCDKVAVMVLAAFGTVFLATFYCSIRVNVLEITYNYSGFVTGAICMCGVFVTAIKPHVAMELIRDNQFSQWQLISYVVLINAAFDNILYVLMGTSKRRLWDMTPEERAYYRSLKEAQDEARKAANTPEGRAEAARKAEEEKREKEEAKAAKARAKEERNAAKGQAKKNKKDRKGK